MGIGSKDKRHGRTVEMLFTTAGENSHGQSLIRVQAGQHCKGQQKGLFSVNIYLKRGPAIILVCCLMRSVTSQVGM